MWKIKTLERRIIMAKSIFEVLDTLETETSVPAIGKTVSHKLPRELFPTAEEFENSVKLQNWAMLNGGPNGCLHACLQKGIQKFLIDVRASFKSCKKDEEWNEILGQSNVNAMKWEITERPKQGGSGKAISNARYTDCMTSIGEMTLLAIPKESIRKIVIKTYGEALVAECFSALEKAAN
jgi:hypothetical protein